MHYIIICQGLVSFPPFSFPSFSLTLAFSLLIIIGSKGKKEQGTILGPRSGYSLITILNEPNLKWKRVGRDQRGTKSSIMELALYISLL